MLGSSRRAARRLPTALAHLLADVERGRAEGRLADGGLEHLVLANEERTRKSLSGSRMLVKVGPSLGLLGTLIPMGTALAALATGNLDAMAGQMVVAFTTTIIGLACGTAAYVIADGAPALGDGGGPRAALPGRAHRCRARRGTVSVARFLSSPIPKSRTKIRSPASRICSTSRSCSSSA